MVKTAVGKELHGHITAIGDQSFKLRPENTTRESEIAYSQVAKVKENAGKTTWIIIGVVVVAVVIVIIATRNSLEGLQP
jgi:hypothetical protein